MRTSSLNAGKAIYGALMAPESDLSGLAVFPLVAPADTRMPYVVYRRSQLSTADSKEVANYFEYANVDVLVVAETYEQSLEVASLVKERLEHVRGTFEDVRVSEIILVGGQEDYINDCYTQSLQFRVEIEIA